ncbi:hypothetical protein NFI96_001951 [Prochilodus magdalenae]|nr:hypothetical protein NFI96_001951 [Prochilodus magdalenae]
MDIKNNFFTHIGKRQLKHPSSTTEHHGRQAVLAQNSPDLFGVVINEVESASFIRSGQKFRKKKNFRRSLKERSSSYESEDDAKKRRRKTATKRKKLDFLEWPRGSSSARSSTQKITTKRKQEGPFECTICGRSIRCQAIMQRHMLTHTGEKPFECDECGRRYTSMSNLRIHQQSHTGKMDYSCEECGQKFTHLSYLKRHLLRHSGKKLHMCDQCGKGFIQKYHLNRHLLVHSGKMPYACDKCNASFNRTDYLSLHMRNVHLIEGSGSESMAKPKKPHKCDLCMQAKQEVKRAFPL